MFCFLVPGRLAEWQDPETELGDPPSPTDTTGTQNQDHQVSPSSLLSGSSPPSLPSDSFDMYYNSHSSMTPRGPSAAGHQQAQLPALPLPDYDTLFPKKRHGIMGQTRWDHIIAEVNQRRLERETDMSGPEMNVDGPYEEPPEVLETAPRKERSTANMSQSSWRQVESQQESTEARTAPGARQALLPPKPTAAASPRQHAEKLVVKPRHSQGIERNSVVLEPDVPQEPPVPASRTSQIHSHSDRTSVEVKPADRHIPSIKPRQKPPTKEPANLSQPEGSQDKNMGELDPFPSSSSQVRDPWNIPQGSKGQDDPFTKLEMEDKGLTTADLDQIFESARPTDPFSSPSKSASSKSREQEKPTATEVVSTSPESSTKKRRAPQPPMSLNDTRNMFMDRVGRHSGRFRSKLDVKAKDTTPTEEPMSTRAEEQSEGLKSPALAWVSPSDVQPAATQSSSGGPASAMRR